MINPRVGYSTLGLGHEGSSKPKMRKPQKSLEMFIRYLECWVGVTQNPKLLKTLIGTLGGKCLFYALLDQSANIKVIKHHKPSNFYIGGFSSNVEEFGLNCKRTP